MSSEKQYKLVGTFGDVSVHSTENIIEDLKLKYTSVDIEKYYRIIEKGIEQIIKKDGICFGNYIIISSSLNLVFPIELRPDKNAQADTYLTTLVSREQMLRVADEAESFMKSTKNNYKQFELIDKFSFYVQSEKVFTDFDEILVE